MGLSLTLKKGGRSFIGIDEGIKGGECTGGFQQAVWIGAAKDPFVTIADFGNRQILPALSVIGMLVQGVQVVVSAQEKNPVQPEFAKIFDQPPDIRLFPANPKGFKRPT
jgi:hypothetical protein